MTTEEYLQRNAKGYEGDTFIHGELQKLVKRFHINKIVETGTYLGFTTVRLAELAPVTTIEISDEYYYKANHNNFGHLDDASNINSLLGNSAEVIGQLVADEDYDNTLWFLDAHWGDVCPLRDELAAIADAKVLNPVIAIHDFQVPHRGDLGFDSYKGQPFTFEWLKDCFDNIYGTDQYDYHYNEIADGANRGIIYVYPKRVKRPRKK